MNAPTASESRALRFGPFLLDLHRRVLVNDGKEVRLGGRAMDLLAALALRPGELVTREELIRYVWPRRFVEETSLRVHVHALRRALGDTSEPSRYVVNVPGKGYRFIAPVQVCEPERGGTPPRPLSNLPFAADVMVGRLGAVQDVRNSLSDARLVTLVGPGGIGKTRVAVAAGHSLTDTFADGIWFVDLSSVSDSSSLAATVAIALGIFIHGDTPWPALESHLQGQRALIVLDNCEHLATSIAALASNLLSIASDLRIIATSHIPLCLQGEHVIALPPLSDIEAKNLFLERARSTSPDLDFGADATEKIELICRRLDGLPLAIELVAARAGALGLDILVEQLSEAPDLAGKGRRASPRRHRSLASLLDWSHDLLASEERIVLRRISVFRASFTLEAAIEIASCEQMNAVVVRERIESLIAKSLVIRDQTSLPGSLRLLNVTRSYAERKLTSSPDMMDCYVRHAGLVCRQLKAAQQALRDVEEDGLQEWHEQQAKLLDDVRAAIDRSFSTGSDSAAGIQVCADARHHVLEFGLFAEFSPRILHALALLQASRLDEPELELRLRIACCFIGIIVPCGVQDRVFANRMLTLIARVPEDDKVEALYGLIASSSNRGHYLHTIEYLWRLRQLVSDDAHPAWEMLGERMLATTYHHLGDHDAALPLMQQVFDHPTRKVHRGYIGQAPRRVTASVYLMRIHWIQGRSCDASALLEAALEADYSGHPMAMGALLGLGGLPLLLWQGRKDRARELLAILKTHAAKHELGFWTPLIEAYEHVLTTPSEQVSPPGAAAPHSAVLATDLFATFAEGMVQPHTLARAESGLVGWCAPEILRANAENRLRRDPSDPWAEAALYRALALARCHNAFAWELRIVCSISRHGARHDPGSARQLLVKTLAQVKQGRETSDVQRAGELLAYLDGACA